MNIQEINIEKFPVVIFTDSHTNLINIRRLKDLYPTNQIVCLGDITFLYSQIGDTFNNHSIEYFIDTKIPCLIGNHESHILACSTGNSFELKFNENSIFADEDKYGLSNKHIEYLQTLPEGFKLNLPSGKHYLCFHNRPNDLWSFTEEKSLTKKDFLKTYPVDNNTINVLIGHQHRNFKVKYERVNSGIVGIGRLSVDGCYALLTENNIEFKTI